MPLYSVSAVCVAGGEGGEGVCVCVRVCCVWYMYVWGWLSKTWLLLTVRHRQEEQYLFSLPKSSYKVKKNPLSPNSMSSVCLLFLPRVKKLSSLKRAVCIFKKKKKNLWINFFKYTEFGLKKFFLQYALTFVSWKKISVGSLKNILDCLLCWAFFHSSYKLGNKTANWSQVTVPPICFLSKLGTWMSTGKMPLPVIFPEAIFYWKKEWASWSINSIMW